MMSNIELQASKYFIGTAIVNLSNVIVEYDLARAHHRPLSQTRIRNIKKGFALNCNREDPKNFLVASVDPKVLANLSITNRDLRDGDIRVGSLLHLGNRPVRCLEGFHRLRAALEFFESSHSDQWWPVKLYSTEMDDRLAIEFLQNSTDEQPFEDGDVLLKILVNRRDLRKTEEEKWWGKLSNSKQNNLKQLLQDRIILNLLIELAEIPALFSSVRLGQLQRLHSTMCNEEIINSLKHVCNVWRLQICANIPPSLMCAIDLASVTAIETRSPTKSQQDKVEIERLMQAGAIFSAVGDSDLRADITNRICSVPYMIPTLRTWLENMKFLEICTIPLRDFAPRRTRGLRQYFYSRWTQPTDRLIEIRPGCLRSYHRSTTEVERWTAWVMLILFCCRNFPDLCRYAPRLESKAEEYQQPSRKAFAMKRLSLLAQKLGFDLPTLNIEATPSKPWQPITGSQSARMQYIPMGRRSGRPFKDDFLFDQQKLFLPNLVQGGSIAAEMTPFDVKHDILQTFLMFDNLSGNCLSSGVVNEHDLMYYDSANSPSMKMIALQKANDQILELKKINNHLRFQVQRRNLYSEHQQRKKRRVHVQDGSVSTRGEAAAQDPQQQNFSGEYILWTIEGANKTCFRTTNIDDRETDFRLEQLTNEQVNGQHRVFYTWRGEQINGLGNIKPYWKEGKLLLVGEKSTMELWLSDETNMRSAQEAAIIIEVQTGRSCVEQQVHLEVVDPHFETHNGQTVEDMDMSEEEL